MSDHHHLLALSLEVLDDAVQDLDAHVHLGLQLFERQLPVARDRVVINGKRLVHLREQHRVATGVVAELLQGIVLQHVDGAALLVDPHRVGAGVAEYPEQLGNVGRQRCGLVRGLGNECLATGREGSEQQQRRGGLQVEPALACAHVVLQRAYARRLARACSRCVVVRRAFAAKETVHGAACRWRTASRLNTCIASSPIASA